MKKIFLIILLTIFNFSIFSPLFADAKLSDEEINELSTRISTEVDCSAASKDPQKIWCLITKVTEADFVNSPAPKAYLGLELELKPNQKIADAAKEMSPSFLSVLYLSPKSGRMAGMEPTDPKNKKQSQELINAASQIKKSLTGGKANLKLSPYWAGVLRSAVKDSTFWSPLTTGKKGGTSFLTEDNYAVRVARVKSTSGDVYVVIQKNTKPQRGMSGIYYLSLHPLKNYR